MRLIDALCMLDYVTPIVDIYKMRKYDYDTVWVPVGRTAGSVKRELKGCGIADTWGWIHRNDEITFCVHSKDYDRVMSILYG